MQELETERLILREFAKSDLKAVHEYASDPEVVRFLEWGPNSYDETRLFLEETIAWQKEKPRRVVEFACVLKGEDKVIGACGIRLNDRDKTQAEMGYCFNRNYWKLGYAREAAGAVLRFAFKELGLSRVYAACDSENLASAGVLRGIGMRQEGHFIEERRIRGKLRDTLFFALLSRELETALSD